MDAPDEWQYGIDHTCDDVICCPFCEAQRGTNYLRYLKCPECKSPGPFLVATFDYSWDDDAWMECEACEHTGDASQFAHAGDGDEEEEAVERAADADMAVRPQSVEELAGRGWPVHRTNEPHHSADVTDALDTQDLNGMMGGLTL
jgi:hypothetical protein